MTRTVLITGASSGIGRETALYFQKQGWNVAATMRSPDQEINKTNSLANLDRVVCLKLDVTDSQTIIDAVTATISKFGAINRSSDRTKNHDLTDYDAFSDRVLTALNKIGTTGALPEVVAKTIYGASTDNSWKLRYPADPIAKQLLFLRKLLPDFLFTKIVRKSTGI